MHGRGPINKMRLKVEDQSKALLAVTNTARGVLCAVNYQQDVAWPLLF